MKKPRSTILLVCRGNIARSPFAAAITKQELTLRHLDDSITVISRGVQGTPIDPVHVRHPNITHYEDIYAGVRDLLQRLNVDMSSHISMTISTQDVEQATVIIVMDTLTADALANLFPDARRKIHTFSELAEAGNDVPDPELNADSTESIFLGIREKVIGNMPRLIAMLNSKI